MNITLDPLAVKIRAEHAAASAAARDAIGHAINAGRLLLEAKGKLKHGEWLPWLEKHCELSERQAQRYMRVAQKAPALLEANPTRVSDLSMRGALRWSPSRRLRRKSNGLRLGIKTLKSCRLSWATS
jgi:Protein of unknown function (DUF3102)